MLYQGDYLNEISFPLGGIGSGSIGLSGNGRLIDWEISGRPSKGSINGFSHISVKLKNKNGVNVRVLNSDENKSLTGQYMQKSFCGFGYGPSTETMCAFPHFKDCVFDGRFPTASLTFSDKSFPAPVRLEAFNPFIPLDSKNSSIPAAFFEVSYTNTEKESTEFSACFTLANPFCKSINKKLEKDGISSVMLINADKNKDEVDYGDLSLSCIDATCVQEYWYRGRWKDNVTTFWREFSENDTLTDRSYDTEGSFDTCSVVKSAKLKPGETANIRFIVSWNIPNNYNYWKPNQEEMRKRSWKNYYATIFENSFQSGCYCLENWDDFYKKTCLFRDELFSSTVDDVIKDAISGTVSVLKSSTMSRLENGELYGFEGVHEQSGSCEGTCQHVYNYVYSTCFLFPDLERSIRDLEFKYEIYDHGATYFRLQLPLGDKIEKLYEKHMHVPCVDGQMGMVFKTYREWKISGDNEWLKSVWNDVATVLEFAWSPENPHKWDPDMSGVITGRQHNTLDIEQFGPNAWLEGFYLAALKAAAEMAEYLGYHDKAKLYAEIFEKGKKWTEENLFNGEYFIQKCDITDKNITDSFGCSDYYWNDETNEIKCQVCDGSEIDQMCGQWHANILGLGRIFDKKQTDIALKSMMKNNFKESMREVANCWRVFALNDEAGTVICDYPEGAYVPKIPITYKEECMTGFEYQFAGLLMSEGFINDGIKVVKAIRDRYDGKKRNPWNEIECGSNYVRPMASYAMLPILSGFSFDLPNGRIGLDPKVNKDNFRCIWCLGTGWGNVTVNSSSMRINLNSGSLTLKEIGIPTEMKTVAVYADGKAIEFNGSTDCIGIDKITITKCLEVIFDEK